MTTEPILTEVSNTQAGITIGVDFPSGAVSVNLMEVGYATSIDMIDITINQPTNLVFNNTQLATEYSFMASALSGDGLESAISEIVITTGMYTILRGKLCVLPHLFDGRRNALAD